MSLITPYLTQRLTVVAKTGYDKWGKPLHNGAASSVPCRLTPSTAVVRSKGGEEITVRASVLLEADAPLNMHDEFICEGERYQVVEVRVYPGLDGKPSHKEVLAR